MRHIAIICLLAAAPAVADPKSFEIDLTGDGKPERVVLKPIPKAPGADGEYEYFQLVVTDAAGKSIWEAPATTDPEHKLVFGSWDGGSTTMPELVGDIDGDGEIELVAPAPQGDVSPQEFRVFRWSRGNFIPVRVSPLLEDGKGFYPWGRSEKRTGRWVSHFQSLADGELTAQITDFKGGAAVTTGVAKLKPTKYGYQFKDWITELAADPNAPAPAPQASPEAVASEAPAGAAPQDAAPQETPQQDPPPSEAPPEAPAPSAGGAPLAEYMCQIGSEDLKSSSGGKLKTLAEVLRQDRANFHKFKIRHRRDIPEETYFANATHRELFSKVRVNCPADLAASAMKAEATLQVRAYADRIDVSIPE